MKKFVLLLVIFVSIFSVGHAAWPFDKYTIDRSELPQEAQDMLNEYFPKAKVSSIKVDKHLLKKTDYDVKLTNGTTIEFSNAGKWTSVDCGKKEVPSGLLLKAITNSVNKKYPDCKVVKVVKKTTSFEITLSDGVMLKYDRLGIFKGVIEATEA